jgi:hypothetical protein
MSFPQFSSMPDLFFLMKPQSAVRLGRGSNRILPTDPGNGRDNLDSANADLTTWNFHLPRNLEGDTGLSLDIGGQNDFSLCFSAVSGAAYSSPLAARMPISTAHIFIYPTASAPHRTFIRRTINV